MFIIIRGTIAPPLMLMLRGGIGTDFSLAVSPHGEERRKARLEP
jgi:hypothetical protein